MMEIILAGVVSLVITLAAGKLLIPALIRLKAGQSIKEVGPTWHKGKQGTPTMGGLGFIFGILLTLGVVYGLFHVSAPEVLGQQQMAAGMLVLFLAFGNGLIGFLDDFIKVVKHRNLGLTAWQKIVFQVAVTVGFMVGLHSLGLLSTSVMFPVAGMVDLGLAYYPIAFFGIIFLVNAVNLTDGIDGLSSSVTIPVMLFFTIAAMAMDRPDAAVLPAALVGGLLAFLRFNWHPAKAFMGDTGSLFLGGVVCGLAFALDIPLVLIFAGFVYIVETMSDILQVSYFKATHGKRLFKMAPIHHHFEMCGWKEEKIVLVFAGVTAAMCVLAWFGIAGLVG